MISEELTRGCELTGQLQSLLRRSLSGDARRSKAAAELSDSVLRSLTSALTALSPAANASEKPKRMAAARRRKEMRTWRTITSAPYHDGHQWRKYGQKNIQNSIHPRSYYRCTYKDGQGCLASKQVQQIDGDDSSRFIVVYSNEHTCRSRPPAWARVEHFDVGDEQSQMLRFGERTKEAAVAPACFSGGGEAVPSSSSSSSDQHDHVRAAINGDERACYLDEFAFGECSSLNL